MCRFRCKQANKYSIEIETRNGIFRTFSSFLDGFRGVVESHSEDLSEEVLYCSKFRATPFASRWLAAESPRPCLTLALEPRNVEGSSLRGGRAAGERDFAAAASATPAAAAGYRLLW